MRPKDFVAALRIYYTGDVLPYVGAADQLVEPALLPIPVEESRQAKKALAFCSATIDPGAVHGHGALDL